MVIVSEWQELNLNGCSHDGILFSIEKGWKICAGGKKLAIPAGNQTTVQYWYFRARSMTV